jgi:hypothetical protein
MRWLRAGGKRDWDGTGGQHRLEMHGISAVSHSVHTCGPAQAFAIVSARMEWMREPRLLRTSYDTWMICALRCMLSLGQLCLKLRPHVACNSVSLSSLLPARGCTSARVACSERMCVAAAGTN